MNKLNFIKLIQLLLPPPKRKPKIVAYLNTLIIPIQTFNNWISDVYYKDVTRRTRWNAQTLLFSKALNDLHNGGSLIKQIYIDGSVSEMEQIYFYNEDENQPVYFFNEAEAKPVYLFNELEYESDFDFVVMYPSELSVIEKQIEASVKKYKLAGATYKMQAY
jgi:hypothetical protein